MDMKTMLLVNQRPPLAFIAPYDGLPDNRGQPDMAQKPYETTRHSVEAMAMPMRM
jgi:hypothetical protein